MLWFYDKIAKKKIKKQEIRIKNIPQKVMQSYLDREKNPTYKQKTIRTGIIQKGGLSTIGEIVLQEAQELKLHYYRKIYQQLLLFKRKNELSRIRKIGPYD